MATSNIAIRFTDETYATKSELSAALGMSSIDSFWVQILAYRSTYQRKIGLKNIHQIPFHATFSPAINQRLNGFIGKLSKFEAKLTTLTPFNYLTFQKEKMVEALRNVMYFEGKKIGELSLRAMVNGTYRESNADHTSIRNYKNALDGFLDKPHLIVSEDFLARYYSLLIDEEELTSFYRTDNLDNTYKFKTTILGRDYSYAQADLIPDIMDEFFSFAQAGGGDPFAKAIMSLFYFDYIKPFPSYNKELACILSKAIISSFGYEKCSGFLNFEEVFKDIDKYKKVALESERSGDLTYLILYALPFVEKGIDDSIDLITKIEVDSIQAEQYSDVKTPKYETVDKLPEEPKPVEEEPIVSTTVETPVVPQPQVSKPVNSVPSTPYSQPVRPTPVTPKPVAQPAVQMVKTPAPEIDVKEFAKYICETNPSIRKQQAVFYANHCAEGHYYSIQDYVKSTKCVYETARTSMDNLAAEGYYRKLKVKNKFVYTPEKIGGK